jgi:hypothetical protein
MVPPSLARLPNALLGPKGIQVLQIHQPAQLHMRRHVLPQSCLTLLCRASLRFMGLPRCVPQNLRPRRASQAKQAPKMGRCLTTSRHRFARASRRRRLQLQKYVRLKFRLNTTMPSVAASPKSLLSRKEFKLLSRWNKSSQLRNQLKSQFVPLKRLYLLFLFQLLEKMLRFPFPFPFLSPSPPLHLPFPRVSLLLAPSLSGSSQLLTWTPFSLSILWALLQPALLPA